MPRYMLTPPPNDPTKFKEDRLYCWAAGLASFVNVAQLGVVGYSDIVNQCSSYMDPDSEAIPESSIEPVFKSYNVYTTNIPCTNFTHDYILNMLQKKGWMIIMYTYGPDMGHTQVVYGIGVPDDSSISIFDPMSENPDYQNIPIADVAGSGMSVGRFGRVPDTCWKTAVRGARTLPIGDDSARYTQFICI